MATAAARVALRAIPGVDLSSGYFSAIRLGMDEDLGGRALDEDALGRVLSGDEDAPADMQKDMTASYEVLKEFMEQEEANRRTTARPGDGYVDFRDTMTLVDDGNERFVWVRNENVPKWRETRPLPASGPPPQGIVAKCG